MAREMTVRGGVGADVTSLEAGVQAHRPAWRRALRGAARKPLGTFGGAIVALICVAAVGAPVIARYAPAQSFDRANPTYNPSSTSVYSTDRDPIILDAKSAPSAKHWLGTDEAGRDIWSRIIWGARRSMGIGIPTMLLAVAVGALLAVVSGYFGGIVDTLMQRVLDAVQAFPALLLLLLIASAFDLNARNLVLSLAFVGVAQVSRVVRSKVLTLRELPFVEAGRVLGATDVRLMARHILPNTMGTVIVVFTIGIGSVILAEASLSFLGLTHANVSWGMMLNSGRNYINSSPWQAVFSGLAITLAVLGFNLLGDTLRDVLDPRLRI
jgi:peptide/nickel transport system permease protein